MLTQRRTDRWCVADHCTRQLYLHVSHGYPAAARIARRLIIALGMLVDNAIVIAEGMLVGVRRGLSRIQAASVIVQQNIWPLLGATAVAVIAFAPIGLSKDASGEYANSLFWVLFISLFLSWFTAITLTPFLGNILYRRDARARSAKNSWKMTTMFISIGFSVATAAF